MYYALVYNMLELKTIGGKNILRNSVHSCSVHNNHSAIIYSKLGL